MRQNVFSPELEFCFLADNALLALTQSAKGKRLSDPEKKLLRRASVFLRTALRGKKLLAQFKLEKDVIQASRVYAEAKEAISKLQRTNELTRKSEEMLR